MDRMQEEEWLARIRSGEITLDEIKSIVTHLRGSRVGQYIASTKSKQKRAEKAVSKVDDLLAGLDGD